MSTKTTLWLLGLAAGLFAFIFFFERHHSPHKARPPALLLPGLNSAKVTAVQVRRGNQFAVRAQRTNESWVLSTPLVYPAQAYAIEGLLKTLEQVVPQTHLSGEELSARRQSSAQFGFGDPSAVIVLEQGA